MEKSAIEIQTIKEMLQGNKKICRLVHISIYKQCKHYIIYTFMILFSFMPKQSLSTKHYS